MGQFKPSENAQILEKWKFRASKCVKIPETDFTENLNDRIIMKFPHCDISSLVYPFQKEEKPFFAKIQSFASEFQK